jgi:D-methionine transport system substrate-binding protein
MKKLIAIAGALALFASLTFASGGAEKSATKVLKIGATPVPHAEILKLIKDDLAKQGIDLQIVEFTDYVTPNIALNDGQIDANFFQHKPYLDAFSADRGLKLEVLTGVHVEPLGLYSKKFKNVKDLPAGATIAIPNDPTNEGRALLLFQTKGLIKVDPAAGLKGTVQNVTDNPKKFQFKEIEAAQLPRTLEDVDASIINGNYALESGLNPVKDSLILEDANSPYVNIVAVKAGTSSDPRFQALVKALHSQKVKDFILSQYKGGVVPAF